MNKKRIEPQVDVIASADVRESEIVRMQGHAFKKPRRRNGNCFDHIDAVEEEYPPLTDDQMRAIRSAAPIQKPGSTLIKKHSFFR